MWLSVQKVTVYRNAWWLDLVSVMKILLSVSETFSQQFKSSVISLTKHLLYPSSTEGQLNTQSQIQNIQEESYASSQLRWGG